MSAERESRQAGNLTAEKISNNHNNSTAKTGNTAENKLEQDTYPQRIALSVRGEEFMSALATDIELGRTELWQLSPALRQFHALAWEGGYVHGHAAGAAAARHEIDRLNYESDLWFYCYANRKTPADFYRHQTDELWREASE